MKKPVTIISVTILVASAYALYKWNKKSKDGSESSAVSESYRSKLVLGLFGASVGVLGLMIGDK